MQDNNSVACCSEHELARDLNALAHPARIQILRYLACEDGSCCKDIVGQLDLAQSTVSQHLKVLLGAGLLRMEREGQKSRYAVDHEAMEKFLATVNTLLPSSRLTRD